MSGCREEALDLLRLGARIAEEVPEAEDRLRDWRGRVEAMIDDPGLESVAGEAKLDALSQGLRAIWLGVAHACSDRHMKSPPLAQPKRTPGGSAVEYSYERNLQTDLLERRCFRYAPPPPGWSADHVLFSSGQAALACFLQSWFSMIRPEASDPLRLLMHGNYFETQVLLGLLRDPGFDWRLSADDRDLQQSVQQGEADLLLMEPVRYEWALTPIDLAGLARALRRREAGSAPVLMFDTTLCGPFFPLQSLLRALDGSAAPRLVVRMNSGLKLDQAGLEFANVGVLSLYTPESAPERESAPVIGHYLRKMRTILGSGLSFDAMCMLEVPWFLDPEHLREHCRAVFVNNALFAQCLQGIEGLFARIAHPCLGALSDEPWAQAPFTVLHLREDDLENHGLLLAVLTEESSRRGLSFHAGSSFGFRGHRYEAIIPRVADRRGLFKVAMGARKGPSRAGVVALLQEIAAIPDIAALRARYPDVRPVVFPLDE